MKGAAVDLKAVAEDGVMLKICKKIHKNAFGDIRLMLAIVKDIFSRKLKKIEDEAKRLAREKGGSEDQAIIPFTELKVTIMEGFNIVEEKYSDVQGSIMSTLSLPIQTCILAIYFSLQGGSSYVLYVRTSKPRKTSRQSCTSVSRTLTFKGLTWTSIRA